MVRKLLLFQYYISGIKNLCAACDNDRRMIGDNKFKRIREEDKKKMLVFLWYKHFGFKYLINCVMYVRWLLMIW